MYEYKFNEATKRNERTNNLLDRRELLRIKMKSLTEEARIIRKEEQRTWGQLQHEMHMHRVEYLRRIARDTHIAYALIKGRSYAQIEGTAKTEPNWDAIQKMVDKYGPRGMKVARHAKAAAPERDPDFARQMELAEAIMHEDKEVLRALAK